MEILRNAISYIVCLEKLLRGSKVSTEGLPDEKVKYWFNNIGASVIKIAAVMKIMF